MSRLVYSFGPFRVDVDERRLTRDSRVVPLAGKAFDTLVALIEGAGTLQRQQALIERLWPDVVVEPNNLQYQISLVRRALGEAAGVEIETVRGQGYRLLAEIRRTSGEKRRAEATPRAQRVQFCRAGDGTRLAYARIGEGPAFVKAANWLSHLELDQQGPVWKHWLELLSRSRCVIRYDARGNGLSDWEPPTITFADFVDDLGAIFDAAGVERAPILGISQGAAVAAAYAATHPERVSALVLLGGCARGWRAKGHPALTKWFDALLVLMRQGWGGDNAAFRQIFTTAFFPEASSEQTRWFNELQRQTATPDNAVRLLSALGDVDVRECLPRICVPTLVVHSKRDVVIPMKDGMELASGIPGARFVALDSPNHLLLEDEPAWQRFVRELEAFLAEAGV